MAGQFSKTTFSKAELQALEELGWSFVPTGPSGEWTWMRFSPSEPDEFEAQQGSPEWIADVETACRIAHIRTLAAEKAAGELSPAPVSVDHRRWPENTPDRWTTLAEVRPAPFWPGPDATRRPTEPTVVVRQHKDTCELRVDIYGCEDGLEICSANGGVTEEERKRNQRWYRLLRTCRGSLMPISVRFLASGAADNVELRS